MSKYNKDMAFCLATVLENFNYKITQNAQCVINIIHIKYSYSKLIRIPRIVGVEMGSIYMLAIYDDDRSKDSNRKYVHRRSLFSLKAKSLGTYLDMSQQWL